MRLPLRRLLAVVFVVLVMTMLAPALAPVIASSSEGPANGSTTAGVFPVGAADTGDDWEMPAHAAEAAGAAGTVAGEDVAEQPRLWLRSVATRPMRPRLPKDSPAPARKPHPSWNARLRVDDPTPDALARTLATPGVRTATAVFLADLDVGTESGSEAMRVAFVDPGGFRVFTPKVTGEAEPLWHALREGKALFTHHGARRTGVRPGEQVTLGGVPVEVGGAASLGTAHVADVVVSAGAVDRRQFDSWAVLIAGVERLDDLGTTAARLQAAGVGTVEAMRPPRPYHAELTGDHPATVAAFEPFAFVPAGARGWLRVDPGWVERNITKTDVPILGEVVCHRLMILQLEAALTEIVERGLDDLIDPDDYGGCFAPRHIGRNPLRSLSMHAWGLAVDFNVHTNLMGDEPRMDPRIVEVFERHGFNWGGRWRTPDGMHFELGVLLDGP